MKIIRVPIIFLLLIYLRDCIIVIPFQTFIKEEPNIFTFEDVIKNWEPNIIYSDTLIGTPPQKMNIILNSQSYGINLFQNMCDLPKSFYIKNESSTFNIEKIINSYSLFKNATIINEKLYFYDNLHMKEQKPFKYMKIIYSDNEEKNQKGQHYDNTCINIGLQLGWSSYHDVPTNLIKQLKNNYKILETYDFSFKYISDNEGIIVIGEEPHIYAPNNYYELQYRMVGAIGSNNNNDRDWFLNFDKLYYTYKIKSNGRILNETIGLVKSIRIQFDMGIVVGPTEYKDMIKRHFFNDLIKAGKCFEKTTKEGKIVFLCDKSAEDNIKNDFPTIYFEMKQFNKIFELTYKDLFREKNGKIFFLVYFREYNFGNYFTIGKIFLKKYFFTFNQDTKMIGFYNENLPGGKNNKRNKEENLLISNIYITITIILILIIIFGALGFYIGKMVYNKVRKKRINEMDDNYDYNSHDDKNDKNLCIDNDE